MAAPAPTERTMPVGYRFRPTDRELVGHYLYRKLMADDPSIHDTVPEIGFCKCESPDLLDHSRFRPTDQELVCHYLHRKLMADDPSIRDPVPEIGPGFWKIILVLISQN